jgi:hypothetical protein
MKGMGMPLQHALCQGTTGRCASHQAPSFALCWRRGMQHRTCAGLQNGANQPQHVGMVPGECAIRAVLSILLFSTQISA